MQRQEGQENTIRMAEQQAAGRKVREVAVPLPTNLIFPIQRPAAGGILS